MNEVQAQGKRNSPSCRVPPLIDLNEAHDGAPQEDHLGGVDGRPDAEVESEAESVDPELVLGPDLAVLHDAEAGADRPEDEYEPEKDTGTEGRVVKLGRVLGGEGQADDDHLLLISWF